MEILRFIVFDILGVTPLLVGFIAMAGLIIQRKAIEKVLSGTFKTIVGFLVFAGGQALPSPRLVISRPCLAKVLA